MKNAAFLMAQKFFFMNKNFFSSGRWKDLFAFSRREKSGIVILFSILAAEAICLVWLHYVPIPKRPQTDFAAFEKAADELEASIRQEKKIRMERKVPAHAEPPVAVQMFHFDPNQTTSVEWQKLGISSRLASTLEKYVAKGGRFRKKEDLLKIYGMTKPEYARLESYIRIPPIHPKDVPAVSARENYIPRKQEVILTDIGIADTLELTHIYGIGVVFARRIHIYREKLGGFYSAEQLREVYGMSDSLFEKILPQVTLGDSANVRSLNLNTADYGMLKNHPYIGRDLAGVIVNYRKQHGDFKNPADVRKIPLVTDELYRKLVPYLKME